MTLSFQQTIHRINTVLALVSTSLRTQEGDILAISMSVGTQESLGTIEGDISRADIVPFFSCKEWALSQLRHIVPVA